MYLSLNSDNLVTLDQLAKASDGTYVNNATVTAQVYLTDYLTAVGDAVALAYVAGSNGKYEGALPHTLALTAGTKYAVKIVADGGGGLHLEAWPVVPCERRGDRCC